LPWPAQENLDLRIFHETKSNLEKDQIRLLRGAGVTNIHPGIESLSDPVLKITRKRVRGMQNIQLQKWCQEMGEAWIEVSSWDLPRRALGGVPENGERVPRLTHLHPPSGASRIRNHHEDVHEARTSARSVAAR
jgi:hypothetical protein